MKSFLLVVILGMLICFLPAYAMQTPPSQQEVEVQGELTLGEAQTKTLTSGTIHVWSMTLEKGHYVVVEVLQKSIDVAIRIVDPKSTHKGEFSTPKLMAIWATDTEKAAWITDAAGTWNVEIAPEINQPGDYEIKWVILHEATEKDRQTVKADSLDKVAYTYYVQGKYTEAEPLFKRSLELKESALGRDHFYVTTSLKNLAGNYWDQAKYTEGELSLKRCLVIQEKTLGPNHPEIATTLNNLAVFLETQARYAEAEPLLKRSLSIREKFLGPGHPRVAQNFHDLANLYSAQSKYAEAEPLYKHSLTIVEKVMGPKHFYVSYILIRLGVLYFDHGKYADAEDLLKRSLVIRETTFGSDHPTVYPVLHTLAQLYVEQDKFAEAESTFKRELTIIKRGVGPNHRDVAAVLGNLANIFRLQARYAEAESLGFDSLEIYEKALGQDHPDVAISLNGLAQTMYFEGGKKLDTAMNLIERAIRIWDTTAGYPESRVYAYTLRSRLRKQKGDWNGAIADLTEALYSAEKTRPRIGGGEEIRAGFFEKYTNHFNRMISWQLEVGNIEKALEFAERNRARVFLDQLAGAQIDLLNSIPEADRRLLLEKRQTNAKGRMTEYQQRINLLPSRKDLSNEEKNQQIVALKDSLKLAEKEYEQVWEEIKLASPLWQNVVTSGGQPVSLAIIQNELVPQNGLLLLYQIGKEGSHLFIIPPGEQKPQAIALQVTGKDSSILQVKSGPLTATGLQEILMDSSAGLLRYLKTSPELLKAGQEKLATVKLQALWRVLVPESIWPKAKACAEVIVVPDGLLHQLPFEALVVQSGATPSDTHYWLDEGPVIRYAPSATILYSLEKRRMKKSPTQPSILSLSDPIFDLEAAGKEMQKQIASRGATPQDSTTTQSSGLMETLLAETRSKEREFAGPLQRLLGTDTETNYIRQYFGAKNVKALQQLQADEPHLRANLQGKRYVHLATHGLVELQQSSLSNALALTPPPQDTVTAENDGFLKLYEIYELKLNTCELAVLSACETHFGRLFEGEGVFALSRGFLAAGAARVVASHWQVNDLSTAELIGAFFRSIATAEKNGKPVDYALALREAKLKLRRDKNRRQWAAPYFWAPFIITGKN